MNDRITPKSITEDFTRVPNALSRLYTRLPKFSAEHIGLYFTLQDLHFYNKDSGEFYAYPSKAYLRKRLNCSEGRVDNMINVLKQYGLLDVEVRGGTLNNLYYLRMPITDEDEFYRAFPQAKQYADEFHAKVDERAKGKRRNLQEFYANEATEEGVEEVTRKVDNSNGVVRINGEVVSAEDWDSYF